MGTATATATSTVTDEARADPSTIDEEGRRYDPTTGYWYDDRVGFYYDAGSGLWYDPRSGGRWLVARDEDPGVVEHDHHHDHDAVEEGEVQDLRVRERVRVFREVLPDGSEGGAVEVEDAETRARRQEREERARRWAEEMVREEARAKAGPVAVESILGAAEAKALGLGGDAGWGGGRGRVRKKGEGVRGQKRGEEEEEEKEKKEKMMMMMNKTGEAREGEKQGEGEEKAEEKKAGEGEGEGQAGLDPVPVRAPVTTGPKIRVGKVRGGGTTSILAPQPPS